MLIGEISIKGHESCLRCIPIGLIFFNVKSRVHLLDSSRPHSTGGSGSHRQVGHLWRGISCGKIWKHISLLKKSMRTALGRLKHIKRYSSLFPNKSTWSWEIFLSGHNRQLLTAADFQNYKYLILEYQNVF